MSKLVRVLSEAQSDGSVHRHSVVVADSPMRRYVLYPDAQASGGSSESGPSVSDVPAEDFPECDALGVSLSRYLTRGVAVGALSGVALLSGAGLAAAYTGAAHPHELRPGCRWGNGIDLEQDARDKANHVQTCWVWSESMQKDVVVQIRASDGKSTNGERGVYFLDGISAPDFQNTWTYDQAGAVNAYPHTYSLVMIAGGAGTWMTDWNEPAEPGNRRIAWETFITKELPGYLGENFGIQKSGNAIVGLSMSAGPALNFAENHPDQFAVVDGVSGFYHTDNPIGWLVIPFIQRYINGIDNGRTAMWGDPLASDSRWAHYDPSQWLQSLKDNKQKVILSAGIGLPSLDEFELMYSNGGLSNVALGVGLELASAVSTFMIQAQAQAIGAPLEVRWSIGAHDWIHWKRNVGAEARSLIDLLKSLPSTTSVTMSSSAALASASTNISAVDQASPIGSAPSAASAAATTAARSTTASADSSRAESTAPPTASASTVTMFADTSTGTMFADTSTGTMSADTSTGTMSADTSTGERGSARSPKQDDTRSTNSTSSPNTVAAERATHAEETKGPEQASPSKDELGDSTGAATAHGWTVPAGTNGWTEPAGTNGWTEPAGTNG